MKYSIIIPHFNRPEIIMNTIKSFKDLKNKEIIIIDDVSTNENIQKLKSNINNLENHIKQDIKLILSEKKLYLPGARNKGIENASGEWIFFIDDDDEATPSFIKWLNKDKQNKKYDFYRFPKITRTKEGDKKNPNIFIKSNIWTIQLSTYLFRREFLIKNNMKFDEEIKAYFEDVLFHQLLYSRHPRTKYKKVYSIFYNTTNFVSITREKSYFEIDEFFIFLDMIDSRKYISKNAIFKILIDAYYTASIHKKGQTEQLKVQRQILPYIIKYDIRFTDMFKGYWISWFHYLKFYLKVSKLKNKK